MCTVRSDFAFKMNLEDDLFEWCPKNSVNHIRYFMFEGTVMYCNSQTATPLGSLYAQLPMGGAAQKAAEAWDQPLDESVWEDLDSTDGDESEEGSSL